GASGPVGGVALLATEEGPAGEGGRETVRGADLDLTGREVGEGHREAEDAVVGVVALGAGGLGRGALDPRNGLEGVADEIEVVDRGGGEGAVRTGAEVEGATGAGG